MVNINLLKSEIVKNGYTQKSLAKELGMSEQTFCRKMKKGVFGTDDAAKIIKILDIKEPVSIFLNTV